MYKYSQVLSTLRVLAKCDFQSEAADIHGISQPSVSRTSMDVIDALNYSLKNITFPSGQAEILQIKEDILKVSNFPNVVGAIDGTLIPIIGMSGDDEHVFVSRKGFHAINMQGIVTADLKCLHKTGGALAYAPAKCVRIIECCCRLYNRAIEEKLPTPVAGQVAIYSNNHTVNTQNIASAVNIRNIIVRRL
ncbi:putative nuclease HARBI1 [Saccostrea cucullata]|uniref:putative nuclease HARBI1 n=1 Tax=Saccostrea cuccullata TaxID=36930 RepID=UPI002ED3CEE6